VASGGLEFEFGKATNWKKHNYSARQKFDKTTTWKENRWPDNNLTTTIEQYQQS